MAHQKKFGGILYRDLTKGHTDRTHMRRAVLTLINKDNAIRSFYVGTAPGDEVFDALRTVCREKLRNKDVDQILAIQHGGEASEVNKEVKFVSRMLDRGLNDDVENLTNNRLRARGSEPSHWIYVALCHNP